MARGGGGLIYAVVAALVIAVFSIYKWTFIGLFTLVTLPFRRLRRTARRN